MARDYWQTFRKVLSVGKLNRTLTIPAFSQKCFFTKRSLWFYGSGKAAAWTPVDFTKDFTGGVTIDFWMNLEKAVVPTIPYYFIKLLGVTDNLCLALNTDTDTLVVEFTNSGSTLYTFSTTNFPYYKWCRVTVTQNPTTNKLKLYIDGVLIHTETTTGALSNAAYNLTIGHSVPISYQEGYFTEFRIYNSEKTQDDIDGSWAPRKRGVSGWPSDNLVCYWPLDAYVDGTGSYINYTNYITAGSYLQHYLALSTTEEYPDTIKFGASFIVTEFPISYSGNKFSLKYPIAKPTSDCNFCLCVRWQDNDGIWQRRKFWTVGEDIAPNPVFYAGEPLNDTAVLEVWNIDGNETVDLASAMTLLTSLTSNPQTSKDHSAAALVTVTENPNIWAAFPIAETQTFNEVSPF